MKRAMQGLSIGIAAIALLACGFLIGRNWPSARTAMPSLRANGAMPMETATAPARAAVNTSAPKVLYWYDPMVPAQHFAAPGKSPFMDMQLVAKYADTDSTAVAGIRVDGGMAQNLAIRLSTVKRSQQVQEIRASGVLAFDERALSIMQSRTVGFVERVWPIAVGDQVKAGQPLLQLLVPEWAAAQSEMLAVRAMGDATLLQAARTRLQRLGMPAALIERVASSGRSEPVFTVTAAQSGVVLSVDARAGMSVIAGQTLFSINGFSDIWLNVAVPQSQLNQVLPGTAVRATIAGISAAVPGTVLDILPELDAASRSLQVRIVLTNSDQQLRPGMRADVTLQSAESATVLTVPTEAIIRTGQRSVVMLALQGGRFAPVEVTLGAEMGAQTAILSGLSEAQQIVSSGQFLFDSEANLSGLGLQEGELEDAGLAEPPMPEHTPEPTP